jgi:hypothetical protein
LDLRGEEVTEEWKKLLNGARVSQMKTLKMEEEKMRSYYVQL